MQVLVMRHGIAVERDDWPEPDSARPLSPSGAQKTRLAARGLSCLRPRVGLIASSPLARAWQTAEIARQELNVGRPVESWPELALLVEEDADLEPLRARIQREASTCTLLVGHEPGCGRLLSLLLYGSADAAQFECKKASVAWLEMQSATAQGGAQGSAILSAFLAPRILRELARRAQATQTPAP